jgi:hypothetical protein
VPDNLAHFGWAPATGDHDGYLYETTAGQTGQVYSENLYVPWSWAGSGNEISVRVTAFRSDILGTVVDTGSPSLWSDPVIIVPDPPQGLLLSFGILALLLGRKLRR